MEDILASIRRILNDDEAVGSEAPDAAAGDARPAAADDVFVLDQTMLIEEPGPMASPPPTPPAMAPPAARAEPPADENARATRPPPTEAAGPDGRGAPVAGGPDDALLAPSAVAAASASLGALVRVIGQQQTPVYRGGPTLEDMVRDEIRPLVKSWLDENLAPMVERMVRAEIARVTGGS